MKLELLDLVDQNMHLEFCKKIMSYKLRNGDLILLLCFCHLFGNDDDDYIMAGSFEFLYDDNFVFRDIERNLINGDHTLIKAQFVEYTNDNGYVKSNSWKMTDKAKNELLFEMDTGEDKSYKRNLILHDKIKSKKMFYNAGEGEAVRKLTSLLQEENYQKIIDRLDSKGMRKGFACLFSGWPGTGKTETVYQIARETKRNIMTVDISQTKSCWFGKSEKKIKKIFDTYRGAVKKSEIAPIMLFNEADAVIGKRTQINSANRSVDQTENTIQNIILQEMENLSGILIATTNLTQNMDSAFERRFLYKITFGKPGVESRYGIWSSFLTNLPVLEILELSGNFELSGGQIENIARKMEVEEIISGKSLSMGKMLQYCKDERDNGFNTSRRIGFAI